MATLPEAKQPQPKADLSKVNTGNASMDATVRNILSDYNSGKSFWKLYNDYGLHPSRVPNATKDDALGGLYSFTVEALNIARSYVIDLYGNLPFSAAEKGYHLKYWDGLFTVFPTMQITKEDSPRLFLWDCPQSPYYAAGEKWQGEFAFQPLVLMCPEDQSTMPNSSIMPKGYGNSDVTRINGKWYYVLLNDVAMFGYLLQWQLNRLMADPWKVTDVLDKDTKEEIAGIIHYGTFCDYPSYQKQIDVFNSSAFDFMQRPYLKRSTFEKIVGAVAIGLGAVMTVVTAGAATPFLAAITGGMAKNIKEAANKELEGAKNELSIELQQQALLDAIKKEEERREEEERTGGIVMIIVVIIALALGAFFLIKKSKK